MSFIKVASISQLHQLMGLPKPQHPLISLVDVSKIQVTEKQLNLKVIFDFYMVSLKDKSCGSEYGRNTFDFDEGVMIFTAPGQVYAFTKAFKPGEISGWMLFFHPDLIRNSHLGKQINEYSFLQQVPRWFQNVEAITLVSLSPGSGQIRTSGGKQYN